jgi:hypothetical protein
MKTPLAAAVVLAFCAGAALAQSDGEEAEAPDAAEAQPPSAGPSPETLALNPLAALDKATLDGFRDRPLFTPSRRRPEPPEEVAVEEAPPPPPPPVRAPPPPPELKLSGVVEGPGGAVAVVENADEGGRIERLRLGDQVGGWLVTAIDGSSLRLTLAEREERYRIFERKEAGAGAAAAFEDEPPPRRAGVPRRPQVPEPEGEEPDE